MQLTVATVYLLRALSSLVWRDGLSPNKPRVMYICLLSICKDTILKDAGRLRNHVLC